MFQVKIWQNGDIQNNVVLVKLISFHMALIIKLVEQYISATKTTNVKINSACRRQSRTDILKIKSELKKI